MKQLALVLGWAFFSVFTILANALMVMAFLKQSGTPAVLATQPSVNIASSVENSAVSPTQDVLGLQTSIQEDDARIPIISNFLERHNSPLQPYDVWGRKLVEIADKYNVDFRLLPAIAMQESNLCKAIPEGTHNCLGFGIHSQGTLGFDSYEESFERAARELKKYYIDIGLTTPQEIMSKYTPHSNGSWAESVMQWVAEMKYDDRQKGRELKENTDLTEYIQPSPTAAPQSAAN